MSMERPSSNPRPSSGPGARGSERPHQRGFTLIEVLVALFIAATAIAALQSVANETVKASVETNRVRIAKMLLRLKAEEFAAGVEQATSGTFEGFPNYEWEVTNDQVIPVTEVPPESVRFVKVIVRHPTFHAGYDPTGFPDSQDPPGIVSVTILMDPPTAELKK